MFTNVRGLQEKLRAAGNLLLLYTVSAMTHIDEDVRVDSLESIRMWLEAGLLLNDPIHGEKVGGCK